MRSEEAAKRIRISSLNMVYKAGASHIGSALSIVDIISVLYSDVMRLYPNNPSDQRRDRFILSKGHACVSVYATLAEFGFIDKTELDRYGQDFSYLMNHISHHVPGVEFSTGSLGHGLPFGVGKALFAHVNEKKWFTYVIMSDGELNEGSNWEAIMFAAHHKLNKLVAVIDYNKLQSLDTVANTLGIEPLEEKFRSFNWNTVRVDGHNHDALRLAFSQIKQEKHRPTMIIADTVKGKGVNFMENDVAWHYRSPSKNELEQAIREIQDA